MIVLALEFGNFLTCRRIGRQIGSSLLETEAKEWLAECLSSILIVPPLSPPGRCRAPPRRGDRLRRSDAVGAAGRRHPAAGDQHPAPQRRANSLLQQADEEDVCGRPGKAFDDVLPQFRQQDKHLTVLRIGDKLPGRDRLCSRTTRRS